MVEQDGYQGNVEESCELSTEVVEKIEKVRNQDLGMKRCENMKKRQSCLGSCLVGEAQKEEAGWYIHATTSYGTEKEEEFGVV
jgi:hypothetical protein